MIPHNINEHINKLKDILQELEGLGHNSKIYDLEYYFEQIDSETRFFNPSERDTFYEPYYRLRNKLQQMQIKIDEKKFISAFKTSKKALFNATDNYINALQDGIIKFHNN